MSAEQNLRPDLCVVGGGAAGLSVAVPAASLGLSVVLIEHGAMGGECLNTGCVPSKALLAAAHRAALVREAHALGIPTPESRADFPAVMDHVRAAIAAIAPNDSEERMRSLGITVIRGTASFLDDRRLASSDGTIVAARRYVLATGSRPAIPAIPGLDQVPYLTNETVFGLQHLPEHLIVIGAGPVGLELGQAFRRLGSAVTILETGSVLPQEEPELVTTLTEQLARDGVTIRANAKAERVAPLDGRIAVQIAGSGAVVGSHLLLATGRRVDASALNLAAAGIASNATGIEVNRNFRTANPRVYAIGDAVAGPRLTHAANYQAGLFIRRSLFGLRVRFSAAAVPAALYTDPELARVGMTEAEARRAYRDVIVLRSPFAHNDRAQAEGDTRGEVKIVSRRGRILGVSIVGVQAGELIAPWVLAMSARLRLGKMTGVVLPYPTRAEAGKRAATSLYARMATKPLVRGFVRFRAAFWPKS